MKCKTCDNEAAVLESDLAGYCGECIKTGRAPMHFLVAITAAAGGLESCSGWWGERVSIALMILGVPRTEFDRMVAERGEGKPTSMYEKTHDLIGEKTHDLIGESGGWFSWGLRAYWKGLASGILLGLAAEAVFFLWRTP